MRKVGSFPPATDHCFPSCYCTWTDCEECRLDIKHVREGGVCCGTCYDWCEFCGITIHTDTTLGKFGYLELPEEAAEEAQIEFALACHCCYNLFQTGRPKNWFSTHNNGHIFESWDE